MGDAANPEPFGTIYVPFDVDDEAFVREVARAMYMTRLRNGGPLILWGDAHPSTLQRFVDIARVGIMMTRVRYATLSQPHEVSP